MSFNSKNSFRKKRSLGRTTPVTIGTHVTDGPFLKREEIPQELSFSKPRKAGRGKRGEVDHVIPKTRSGESVAEHARRVKREQYGKNLQRKNRIKGIVIGALAVLLIAIVAGGVGMYAYASSVSDKMSLTDGETKAALTAPSEGEAEYLLLVAEFSEPGKNYDGPGLITLVRLDRQSKQVTLMSIPPNLGIQLSNGEYGRLSETQLLGGDGALIGEIEDLTGVSISHIIKTEGEGFVDLVDSLGGLTVDITEEVDDPMAGSFYIPAGTQTLGGEAALTLCRATNVTGGVTARAENQNKVTLALAEKVLNSNDISLVVTLDGIADKLETDYGAPDAIALIDAFKGISSDTVFVASMPGYVAMNAATGINYFYPDDTNWAYILTALKEGRDPAEALPRKVEVDPASFEIIVRNGSGITGGASQVADSLTSGGYLVKETGNADRYVYDETLVIYQDAAYAPAAESIVSHLGVGRVVTSSGFYLFDTPVLVVVGKDWKPLN